MIQVLYSSRTQKIKSLSFFGGKGKNPLIPQKEVFFYYYYQAIYRKPIY